ncbi:MAG: hypothetical protein PVF39_05075, partial [Desulfobacterales bacterium]
MIDNRGNAKIALPLLFNIKTIKISLSLSDPAGYGKNLQTASRCLWNAPVSGRADPQLRVQVFKAHRLQERCHASEKQQIR